MLFVLVDVMKVLCKNFIMKDLFLGLLGQGIQCWILVCLLGDKIYMFEICINFCVVYKFNMNFQYFRVGCGYGFFLELKNVFFLMKGKIVLDRFVEFYKNCGSG